jgi:hypothetical protein
LRLDSGKIVFDCGHREGRGCQELQKSEQGRERDERKRERKMKAKEGQSHCGQAMHSPGGQAISGQEAPLNSGQTASAEVENLQIEIKRRLNGTVQLKGPGWDQAPNRHVVEKSKKGCRGVSGGIPAGKKVLSCLVT